MLRSKGSWLARKGNKSHRTLGGLSIRPPKAFGCGMSLAKGRLAVPRYVLVIDFVCLIFALIGFTMGYRQAFVRRIFSLSPQSSAGGSESGGDHITYILRISGTMVMVFGIAIGVIVTLFYALSLG